MARVTRETSKARTRERVLAEAERLFRERGYAATSLEQIAEAADVTKGAIYGHFSSKEDLLLSAIEAAPTPDYGAVLNDLSRPLRERLAEFGAAVAADKATTDKAGLAVSLEFVAALLRSPDALRRYGADLEAATGGAGRGGRRAASPRDHPHRSLGHRPRAIRRAADLPVHRAGDPHARGVRARLRAARRALSRALSFSAAH
jgi:AcrR family transcriptional regulator